MRVDIETSARGALEEETLRGAFSLQSTYLNSAAVHPLPLQGVEALRAYGLRRGAMESVEARGPEAGDDLRKLFARLVNAASEDVALVPSTMFGENLVALGLGLGAGRGSVVTDALHFEGSLALYGELARQGVTVTVVPHRSGRVELEDYERALRPGATLVALSLVSAQNGFQHDLKAICDLAHARGALVFADVIQAAGAVELDVRAAGVDACACSSYKWLMGDFGVGFLYTTPEARLRMRRILHGHDQLESFQIRGLPWDDPALPVFDYRFSSGANGLFGVGVKAAGAIAATTASLCVLMNYGVERVQARRRPLMRRLEDGFAELGFLHLAPTGTDSPIITVATPDAKRRFQPALEAANIIVSLQHDRIRISPTVFNDMDDIERLLETVAKAASPS